MPSGHSDTCKTVCRICFDISQSSKRQDCTNTNQFVKVWASTSLHRQVASAMSVCRYQVAEDQCMPNWDHHNIAIAPRLTTMHASLHGQMHVQLGSPSDETYKVVLCEGLDPELPQTFGGEQTDCWLKCSQADILSKAAKDWLAAQLTAVQQDFETFLHLLWYVCALIKCCNNQRSLRAGSRCGCYICQCFVPSWTAAVHSLSTAVHRCIVQSMLAVLLFSQAVSLHVGPLKSSRSPSWHLRC